MTNEQRAAGVFDFFLRHGWVAEEHRKQIATGIELAIAAATDDAGDLRRFLDRLLNPSDMGRDVSARVRDECRVLLGMKRVETGKGK
jgi:hypothetical protein